MAGEGIGEVADVPEGAVALAHAVDLLLQSAGSREAGVTPTENFGVMPLLGYVSD